MAGASGKLPRNAASESLTGTMVSVGRGTAVAVGPWLFTMAALVLISVVTGSSVGRSTTADFRGLLIYAFALSLVAAAPFVLVLSRILSDAVFLDRRSEVQPIMLMGSFGAGIASAALSGLVGWLLFGMEAEPLIALMQAAGLAGMMWVHLAIAGAMREYLGISITFIAGLTVAMGATLVAAIGFRSSSAGMVFAFNLGLAAIVVGLAVRELHGARCPELDIAASFRELSHLMRRYWLIAVGACLSAIAMWVDKWVMWAGPDGHELRSGLMHSPLYDSAAFLAYLTIIPSLARFVMALDGEYIEAYRSYFGAIKGHATLDEINRKGAALGGLTSELIEGIFIQQVAVCAIVVLCAPLIVELAHLQYAQISILRLCTIAVLFQFVFLAATALLIFFERHREFFLLQVLFLTLNAGATIVTIQIGQLTYGFGMLVASVVSGIAAYAVLTNVVRHIDYFTFIDGAVRMHKSELDTLQQTPTRDDVR